MSALLTAPHSTPSHLPSAPLALAIPSLYAPDASLILDWTLTDLIWPLGARPPPQQLANDPSLSTASCPTLAFAIGDPLSLPPPSQVKRLLQPRRSTTTGSSQIASANSRDGNPHPLPFPPIPRSLTPSDYLFYPPQERPLRYRPRLLRHERSQIDLTPKISHVYLLSGSSSASSSECRAEFCMDEYLQWPGSTMMQSSAWTSTCNG
nr:uncharacterized protein LOC127298509 isoform X2 [Lolium perenne]